MVKFIPCFIVKEIYSIANQTHKSQIGYCKVKNIEIPRNQTGGTINSHKTSQSHEIRRHK